MDQKCPFELVKVVIIGQDPYHGVGQANGLLLHVNPGVAMPPSLVNIFAEIHDDVGSLPIPPDGDLSRWAAQGVLLLNSSLTVEAHRPTSHIPQSDGKPLPTKRDPPSQRREENISCSCCGDRMPDAKRR